MSTVTRFSCGSVPASLLSSLLLVSLVVGSTAFRSRVSEEATHNMSAETHAREWQKKTYLFCLGAEQMIECNGEKEKIEIFTAMYNRNQKLRKEVCGVPEPGSKWRNCGVDAKEMVRYRCEGTQRCQLIPSDHAICPEDPFYQMRLVIKCSAGEPRPEPPRANCPHEQDHPCTEGMASTTTPELDPVKLAGYAADLPDNARQYLPDAAKKLLDAPKSTTTEEPLVIENVAELKVVKAQVTKEIEDPSLEGVSLVPCYRFTRTQKMSNGNLFGSWRDWQILARLTNCGKNEGCFHLAFPDGSVYKDQNVPPTSEQLAQGDLTQAKDNLWVTFRGTGLKRNDYGTWGVCMPKTKDLQFATELWEAMRKGQATGKLEA